MPLIPKHTKPYADEFDYYVRSKWKQCPYCRKFGCKLVNIKIDGQMLYFYFGCDYCTEEHFVYVTVKKLTEIMFQHLNGKRIANAALFEMFRLGIYYPELLDNAIARKEFDEIVNLLKRKVDRWGWLYKIMYARHRWRQR